MGSGMKERQRKDYYGIIGVSRRAGADQIRAAYRAKARTCHPDVCDDPSAACAFAELAEAYGVLSDAERRRDYDAALGSEFLPEPVQRILDDALRRLPEDPLPFLMKTLQIIGISIAAILLVLAILYIL